MTQQSKDDQRLSAFNPNDHMMQLKSREGSKDYLPVQWRLVWFREACPQGTIDTEEVEVDLDREMEEEVFAWNPEKKRSEKIIKRAKGYARFRATVTDGKGGKATATKSECAASFSDYIEKAETGAIGRALAHLGYGTAFAPELNEEHRIVDSGIESVPNAPQRPTAPSQSPQPNHRPQPVQATPAPSPAQQGPLVQEGATEKQVLSIRKLCEHLGKPEPQGLEAMSFADAKTLIETLTQEYRQSRAQATSSLTNIPTPSQLMERCVALFGNGKWEEIKRRLLKVNVANSDMTPEQCAAIDADFKRREAAKKQMDAA